MKLRLLSLVLLGITLIDVTQARTIEKKEINEEDYPGKREVNEEEDINIESDNSVCSCNNGECNRCDNNGCQQVSNCNGKREASKIDYGGAAKLIEMFKADNSKCKCLNGYCLKRELGQMEYTVVNGCGERKCYTNCDSSGCTEVCDGECKCVLGHRQTIMRCEECDDKGCEQVKYCQESSYFLYASNCTECNKYGCVEAKKEAYGCNRQCNDDVDDILTQDKCVCKIDKYGKEKCQMCDKYRCNPVIDCSRFATCTLDHRANTYRRCYGYNHGESYCRTMYSAVEFKKRDEEVKREEQNGRTYSCECPSNGGECKICANSGYCKVGGWNNYKCSDRDTFNVTAHLH